MGGGRKRKGREGDKGEGGREGGRDYPTSLYYNSCPSTVVVSRNISNNGKLLQLNKHHKHTH